MLTTSTYLPSNGILTLLIPCFPQHDELHPGSVSPNKHFLPYVAFLKGSELMQ